MTEERQAEHPFHPQRVADRGTDEHRDRHTQKGRPGDRAAAGLIQVESRSQAGKMSPRVTNENAEATRAMQLATNNRRGFMRSVSGAIRSPPHGERLVLEAELFLDNRAVAALPGGSRSAFHRRFTFAPSIADSVIHDEKTARPPSAACTPGRRRPRWSAWSPACSPSAREGASSAAAACSSFTAAVRNWFADWIGFGAMTLGHVIIGRDPLLPGDSAATMSRPTSARSSAGALRSSRRTCSPVSWHGGRAGITISTTGSSATRVGPAANPIDRRD